uniref:Uncharacterized protein n=1 Tax=Anguilla anguilla TaxID=7936 RepID=A0A0E9WCU5_ANGAN
MGPSQLLQGGLVNRIPWVHQKAQCSHTQASLHSYTHTHTHSYALTHSFHNCTENVCLDKGGKAFGCDSFNLLQVLHLCKLAVDLSPAHNKLGLLVSNELQ